MAKFNDIRELAQQNARWVSNSPKDWMNYLDVAARLYRYSFKDTLLIHAQRPDATACAELEVWNKKMNRWVNRGAKGIALLDDASPRAKLRYVFDIADTHLVQGGRTPILWRIDDSEHQQMILDHLADPPLMEKPMNQKPSLHQMEHYQKFYENGEYVRAVESTTEQNYNMIDGCANNLPKPRIINGRESVLDKLRIRQMAREKQKSSQEQSADMERNRK